MSKEKITRALLAEDGSVLVEQADGSYRKGEGRTDWARLSAMSDDEIDYSEIPELDAAFWAQAEVRLPETKGRITIRLDQDVLGWLKGQGSKYQTRINAILRQYMEAHQHQTK